MGFDVSPVTSNRDLDLFLNLSAELRPDDLPNLMPPPWMRPLLDRRANPYFRHADHELLLAKQDGRLVGRVALFVDHLCNRTLGEQAGIFGFFDCVNSQRIAAGILAEGERWMRDKGVTVVRGPLGPSMRMAMGVLVDGLGQPPMPGLSNDPPVVSFLLEQAGYQPTQDFHAYRIETGRMSPEVTRSADLARRQKGLVLRRIRSDKDHFDDEMMRLCEVLNDLSEQGIANAPWSEAELKWVSRQIKVLLDPSLILFVEKNRVPAGVGVAFRNIRESLGGGNPFGSKLDALRVLTALKFNRLRSARIALLAVRPQFQSSSGGDRISGGSGEILSLLLAELLGRLRLQGVRWVEVSLVDPMDRPMVELLAAAGGEPYKTYRIYEKILGNALY